MRLRVVSLGPAGIHVAKPGPGDDDRHQRGCGLWEAAAASRDLALSECQAGSPLRAEPAQGHGKPGGERPGFFGGGAETTVPG